MLIKDSIIKFFKQKMSIDITNVSIVVSQLPDNEIGQYNHSIANTITIDVAKISAIYKGASDIMLDTCVVHELMHLCQFQYNKSLILPINNLFSGRLINNRYVHLPAYQQPIEIDALIMECYYLYCSDEYYTDRISPYVEHRLTNVGNVKEYTQRLKDDGFNLVINSSNNLNEKEC